ncbi:hypothetical protein YW5DRAFT_06999, partial [Streptomyces sp. Ncost-T6T-1]
MHTPRLWCLYGTVATRFAERA